MTKQEIINEVRSLTGNAEPGKALMMLVGFFEQDKSYKHLQRIGLKTQSLLKQTKEKEKRGTLSAENIRLQYNLVNDSILKLVDHIEQDKYVPEGFDESLQKTSRKKWIYLLLGGLICVLIGVGYYLIFPPAPSCPEFLEQSEVDVMLLPFKSLGGGELSPETAIKARLISLCEKQAFPAGVEIFSNFFEGGHNDFPGEKEAEEIGKNCQVDMLIWGTAENAGDEKIVHAKYKYLGERNGLTFNQLKWEGEKKVDTLKAISNIMNQGELTAEIETLLMAILLHHVGRTDEIIPLLETVEPTNSDEAMVTNMLLADCYINKNELNKALTKYETVLETHPNYWLARINKGMLALEQDRPEEAISDFTKVLKKRPKEVTVIKARGDAYLKADQLKNAKEDFQKVKKMEPGNVQVDSKLESIELKLSKQQKILDSQKSRLANNPNNLNLVAKQTETAKKLGMDKVVKSNSERMMNNPAFARKGAKNLIQMYELEADTVKLLETVKMAKKKGISEKELMRDIPNLRPLLNQAKKN